MAQAAASQRARRGASPSPPSPPRPPPRSAAQAAAATVSARGGGGGVAARGEPTASSIWRISRCSSVGGASLISALGGGVVGVRVEAIDESECARRWPGVVCGGFMYGGGSASSPPGLNKFGNSVMRGDAPVTERGDSDGLDGSTRALLRGDESTLRVAWTFFSSLSPGLKSRSSSPRGVSGDDGGVGVSLSSGIGVDGAGQDVTGCSEMTTRRSRARRTRERGAPLLAQL